MDAAVLRRLFAHDAWANRAALDAIRGPVGTRALRVMGHVIGAEWLWLSRIRGQPSPVEVWPEVGLAECRDQVRVLARKWDGYVSALTAEETRRDVPYVNSKGEPWTSRVEDILLHVVLHSSYHRGQAAMALRDAGEEPAYTDYIHCIRSGLLE